MPELLFNGVRSFYKTWGQGMPLALLHSGGSSSAQWDKVGEALTGDHRLIAPDLLGFGATGPWPVAGALTQCLQADLVAEILLAEASTAIDVVGHSYGGGTAVRLALRRPELVRSLILVEPILTRLLQEAGDPLYAEAVQVGITFCDAVQAGTPEHGWQVFIDSRSGVGTWSHLSEKAKARFLIQSNQTAEAFVSLRNHVITLAECASLRVPMTIVCGGETYAPDRRVTEILREAVSHARYVAIPGAGHMSPMTHPVDVARIIRAHVARQAQNAVA